MKKAGSIFWLVVVLALLSGAIRTEYASPTKQVGGSTGDSLGVAPDTSAVVQLRTDLESWWVAVAADSMSMYRTQVSPDGSRWFTVDTDTVPAGQAEATVDSGGEPLFVSGAFGGWYIRVIVDNLTAAGAPYGRASIFYTRDR